MKSFGWQAQRVADTALGATFTAGEKVADTVKPLRSQAGVRRQVSRLQRRAATNLRKAERRGANARRRAARILRRNRREAERQVKSTQDGFERRVDDAQTAAEELARRVGSDARSIV